MKTAHEQSSKKLIREHLSPEARARRVERERLDRLIDQAQRSRRERVLPKLINFKFVECSHGVHWTDCLVCSKPRSKL